MSINYLNRESDEIEAVFSQIDRAEKIMRTAEANHCPSIRAERYLSGEEVCDYLHISVRTLQTLRDTRTIPFTVVDERTIFYPEAGIKEILKKITDLPKNRFNLIRAAFGQLFLCKVSTYWNFSYLCEG